MNISLITGLSVLIGNEAVKFFINKLDKVIGINDKSRSCLFLVLNLHLKGHMQY